MATTPLAWAAERRCCPGEGEAEEGQQRLAQDVAAALRRWKGAATKAAQGAEAIADAGSLHRAVIEGALSQAVSLTSAAKLSIVILTTRLTYLYALLMRKLTGKLG